VAFPSKLLNEGEEVVLDLRPHWWFFAGPAVTVLALTILAIAARNLNDVIRLAVVAALVASLLWLAVRAARWSTTNFVVTTDRLVFRSGVLGKSGMEIPLNRVNTIFFNQSLLERLLGCGDLVIESAGERGQEHFTDIRKPSLVQNVIYRQIEENENRKLDRRAGPSAPGGGGPAHPPSIPEQIEKLDELRRRGVLTDAEFQAKKAELLGRM
jgi:membrane protein YdbS with pleckstrin-like domain